MKTKCVYCQQEIEEEELEKHQFVCVSSYQKEEFDFSNKIPCEICHELIDFEHYDRHLNICSLGNTINSRIGSRNLLLPLLNFNFPTQILTTPETSAQNVEDATPIDPEQTSNNQDAIETEGSFDNENLSLYIEQNMNMLNQNLNLINQMLYPSGFNTNTQDSYEALSRLDADIIKEGVKLSEVGQKFIVKETMKCPICMDDFPKDSEMFSVKCDHSFCEECLTEWLEENKKCPICMIEL